MFKRLFAAFLIFVIMTSCAQKEHTSSEKVELLISAASSLTESLKEIQIAYEKEHLSVQLTFNFGGSGTLQHQIEQGAPVDLFLSAGNRQMNTLKDKQIIDPNDHNNLLTNELVVIVPTDIQFPVNTMKDITKPEVKKMAIGEPGTVPVGNYAKDSLVFHKLWDEVQPKTVFAKDVRQVLNYVETGNTDVGFVYKTDTLTSQKVKIAFSVDPQSYKPIEYPVGIVKATKNRKEAEAFYKYLQSKSAQDIFIKHGFSLPKP